jgi:hypothetical protein
MATRGEWRGDDWMNCLATFMLVALILGTFVLFPPLGIGILAIVIVIALVKAAVR